MFQRSLPRIISDHMPILFDSGGIRQGRSPFRFENIWLLSEGFVERVGEWWNSYPVMGKPSFILAKKLKLLKEDLRKWNCEVFGRLEAQKAKVVDTIRRIDLEEQVRSLTEEEQFFRVNAKEEFGKIAKFEEITWRQKKGKPKKKDLESLVALYEQNDKPSSAIDYVQFTNWAFYLLIQPSKPVMCLILCTHGFSFNRFIHQKLGGPTVSEYEKLQAAMSDLQIRYDELRVTHQEKCRKVRIRALLVSSCMFLLKS
ncbi:hypothetical protein RHGRI_020778 [Rhododendron griersonianum]|uniref:Uncharacterized protein n=1 Tax=Rhododendron griersonianum TaxID=479676 RepID=A0AAV6JL02_9ERIC|nr:hypothetical protein RHGRI_020778 [Rhododendron griersonianum]